MALIGLIPDDATPGRRVKLLARRMGECAASFRNGTLAGEELTLYLYLTKLMCWDAALLCAWAAKGIECDDIDMVKAASGLSFKVVKEYDCTRIFGADALRKRSVTSAGQLMDLPEGCFIGFISQTGTLRHCMLHLSDGMGAGNKNNCVLGAGNPSGIGWEILDMTAFFFADANLNENATTTMIYAPVRGQRI